jgi:hypothetical protein
MRFSIKKRVKGIRFMFTYVERSCVSFGRSYTIESTLWKFMVGCNVFTNLIDDRLFAVTRPLR